jgi:D-3-phosphoglycerate dehydrogenase
VKKVLVIQPLRAEALALFDARPDIEYQVLTDFSEANLLAHVSGADAITIRDAPLPKSVIAAGNRLSVVSRHGVGYDNIPVDECAARGIPVTVVGPVNAVSVAEQTMFLMLAAARAGVELDEATRRGDFGARSRITGVELRARRLVIVGFGQIGREVAARARAFGMRITVVDPLMAAGADPSVEVVDNLADALPAADILTLHVPLTDGTRHMIGAKELALLPAGAILVNASRGGLVDEDALVASIRSGRLRGAGLDTFETEPLPTNSPLLAERRIVLSPHSAALTEESLLAMGMMTVRNVLAAFDDTLDPRLVVNHAMLAGVRHAAQ